MMKLRLCAARLLLGRDWRAVPRFPTLEQSEAGRRVVRESALNAFAQDRIYRAMVEAAE